MKRLLCFVLVCILTLGTCILPIVAVPEIPTDSDRYLIDEFYQTVFENYRFFMDQQPGGWSGLSSGSIYGYSESAEKMKNNKHIQPTLDIAHFLIEASWYEVMFGEYDVDDIKLSYYVTALSSLLMTMEDNMGDMKVAQARATASMTWLDYAEKAASAAAAFGGVYSGDVGYKRLETAFEICGIGIDTLGDTINTRQHYEVLALNTETYMTYRTLLQVLKEKSADPLLSEAAGYLMSVIDRNFQYRIEHFRDFGEIALDMQSNSFFNLLDDMIDGLKKAGLDKDDDYIALAVLAKVTDWVGKFKIGVQIGEIFSDVLFGGSDLMQRYYEIYAMESVRETLISCITSKDAQIKSADDISTIYDVIEFANILNYVNLRGAYCVYRINATDGHLLSLALGAKNAEEWYNSVQRICQDYQEYVSFLIPDLESYTKKYDIQFYNEVLEQYSIAHFWAENSSDFVLSSIIWEFMDLQYVDTYTKGRSKELYYSIIDINNDGVNELIIANNSPTPESFFEFEADKKSEQLNYYDDEKLILAVYTSVNGRIEQVWSASGAGGFWLHIWENGVIEEFCVFYSKFGKLQKYLSSQTEIWNLDGDVCRLRNDSIESDITKDEAYDIARVYYTHPMEFNWVKYDFSNKICSDNAEKWKREINILQGIDDIFNTDRVSDDIFYVYDIDRNGIPEIIRHEKDLPYSSFQFYSYQGTKFSVCKTDWLDRLSAYRDGLYVDINERYDNGIYIHDGGWGAGHFEYLDFYSLENNTMVLKSSDEICTYDYEELIIEFRAKINSLTPIDSICEPIDSDTELKMALLAFMEDNYDDLSSKNIP